MILIIATPPGQSGPVSNGNKRLIPHCPEIQNLNLTIGFSLVSCPGHDPSFIALTLTLHEVKLILSSTTYDLLNIKKITSKIITTKKNLVF